MDDFTQLRKLLLEEEQTWLNQLNQRLDDPLQRLQETAQVLPQALDLLVKQQPEELQKALQAPVEHCMTTSFHTDPHKFAKPLLNAMSQPLRKAIADSFKSIREFVQANQEQINKLDERVQHIERRDWDALLQKIDKQEKRLLARLKQFEADIYDRDKRTNELARILPNAIRKASESPAQQSVASDKVDKFQVDVEELSASLKGPVERSLRQSISDDPHSLANALFPIMGPAIRKSINESIKGLINNINRTVERSLSPQGMAWRLEALRTGRPFGEIVLQKTLVYRVEQVFLIHRESGLLIQHRHLEGVEMGDSDAVSAMLTAIQDFIRDSFSKSKKEELDSVDIGEFTVWLERGPYAVLACVIRGNAPYAFRSNMKALLELMHARYGHALERFEGDSSSLEVCAPFLQRAMQVEEVEAEKQKQKRRFSPVVLLLSFSIIAATAWFSYQEWQAYLLQQQVDNYLHALAREPGIIVTQTHYNHNRLYLRGLRDPLARTHTEIAKDVGFTALEITTNWQAYQAMSPEFTQQRLHQQAARWLRAPDSVDVQWQGTKLVISGHADKEWVTRIENDAPMLVGLSELDTSNLVENDAYWRQTQAQFDAFLKALNNTPGIIVVSSGIENNKRIINGMRDPLAADPNQIAEQMQIRSVDMRWRNYQDLTPEFVRQRVNQYLAPVPASVKYQIDGNLLRLSGHAAPSWIDKALRTTSVAGINQVDNSDLKDTDSVLLAQATAQLKPASSVTLTVKQAKLSISGATSLPDAARMLSIAPNLEGITAVDASGLQDQDAPHRQILQTQINETQIMFADGVDLAAGQTQALKQLAQKIQQLAALNAGLQPPLQVVVSGHTDGLGSRENNQLLSQARAEIVKKQLLTLELPQHILLTQMPEKILFGEHNINLAQRKVTFKVVEQKIP